MVWYNMAWFGVAKRGVIWHMMWCGMMLCECGVVYNMAWSRCGVVLCGVTWHDMVYYVVHCMAWSGITLYVVAWPANIFGNLLLIRRSQIKFSSRTQRTSI